MRLLPNKVKAFFNSQTSAARASRFLFKLVFLYAVLDSFFTFYIGLTVPGGSYSPLLHDHLDFISAFRRFLLWGGAHFASLIGYPSDYTDYKLLVRNGSAVRMVYSCLGFSLMSAYAALVLAWPARFLYKIVSVAIGTIIIILLNMIRLGGLAVVYTTGHYRVFDYVDHHDLFNIVVIVVVFAVFVVYVKYLEAKAKN